MDDTKKITPRLPSFTARCYFGLPRIHAYSLLWFSVFTTLVLRTFITLLTSPLNWNKIRNIKKKESARCFILVNLTANITTNNQAGYGVIGVKQTINAAIYTLSKKKGIVEALAMGSKICSASQHSNLPLLR